MSRRMSTSWLCGLVAWGLCVEVVKMRWSYTIFSREVRRHGSPGGAKPNDAIRASAACCKAEFSLLVLSTQWSQDVRPTRSAAFAWESPIARCRSLVHGHKAGISRSITIANRQE